MRNAFVNELVKLARGDSSVFLITGDLGYSVLEPFMKEFPDRFLNIGVAEQNMIGVAAGLAKEGYCVFVYSIGNFPTMRCFEQIRYDICYHELNVKIIAVGSGFAYGPLGVSHHATEDLGSLRTLPNLSVTSPSDALEVEALTQYMVKTPGPVYMRLNKANEPLIHKTPLTLIPGFPVKVIHGKKTLIVSTGSISKIAYDAAIKEGWSLWTFPFINPLSKDIVHELIQYERIISLEEHQLNCGFGSAILELLSDAYNEGSISVFPKVQRIAIPNKFIGYSGTQEYLRKVAGLFI